MNSPELSLGVYDYSRLRHVKDRRKQLNPFSTGDWAGMQVLRGTTPEGARRFPQLGDKLEGYLKDLDPPNKHPLLEIGAVLRGQAQPSGRGIRLAAALVGNAVGRGGPSELGLQDIQESIEEVNKGGSPGLDIPSREWGVQDYSGLYDLIRRVERDELMKAVVTLGVALVDANKEEQMYVAAENGLSRGTGWLAPLAGLSVDTANANAPRDQVHDVVPVVLCNDKQLGLLAGCTGYLYTCA